MSDISKYLTDHAAAGHCAHAYYNNTHVKDQCPASPGTCSVIAYLVVELKNAEQRARVDPLPQYVPSGPVERIPNVTSGGGGSASTNASGGGAGGSGQLSWSNGSNAVESR